MCSLYAKPSPPMLRRAQRLAILALSGLLATVSASAQPSGGKTARVAWVSVRPEAQVQSFLEAFRAGLASRGYVEGRNLEFIVRSADGAQERMPTILEEIVASRPDVIVTHAAAIYSARQVTTVPIVFGFSGDPVIAEVTDSLARPSRNLTGVTLMQVELNEKRLDFLHQIAPEAKTVVLMGDPVHPGADLEVETSQRMAGRLGISLRWVPTRDSTEVQAVLSDLDRAPPDALIVLPDALLLENRQRIAEFAIRHRIPAVSGWSAFAESGGLFTYGPRLTESFRRVAYFAARILEGASPSDLPIEQPTVIELVVNLRTARAVGLTLPDAVLVRADEVIE